MSEELPSISVVIPTADRGAMLKRCLDSVLSQSHAALEIVVVDNGQRASLVDCSDERIKVIRTPPMIGPGRARNVGAGNARGDYVSFLDDDDVWDKDYLKHVLRKVKEYAPDAILAQLKRDRGDGRLEPYKLMPESTAEQRRVFFSNPGFGGQNLTIRSSVFRELDGFDETMPASVDRDLAARLLLAGKHLIPQPNAVAILCDHDGRRVRNKQVKGNWAFLKKHWKNMYWTERWRASRLLFKRWRASVRTNSP